MRHQYSVDPDVVFAIFVDPAFLRGRAERMGERNIELEVQKTTDSARIVLSRDITVDLPPVVRRLFAPTQRVREEAVWSRAEDGWAAHFVVQVKNVPGDVRGHLKLEPRLGGCTYEGSFHVRSWLPIITAKLEDMVADQVETVMREMVASSACAIRHGADLVRTA